MGGDGDGAGDGKGVALLIVLVLPWRRDDLLASVGVEMVKVEIESRI